MAPFKPLLLVILLTPASERGVPVSMVEDNRDCEAKSELFDPLYEDFTNREWFCVRWSYAPETSPFPTPKPERK